MYIRKTVLPIADYVRIQICVLKILVLSAVMLYEQELFPIFCKTTFKIVSHCKRMLCINFRRVCLQVTLVMNISLQRISLKFLSAAKLDLAFYQNLSKMFASTFFRERDSE